MFAVFTTNVAAAAGPGEESLSYGRHAAAGAAAAALRLKLSFP